MITSVMFNYNKYREKSITGRWVKYKQLSEYLNKFSGSDRVKIETAGKSVEGKPIQLLKIGSGNKRVLFWSQMHGDESTSTRAILDLLNFITDDDEDKQIREKILSDITLFIIPMLNPDGAEIFQRTNSQKIDINRDAVRLQSPEAKILYEVKNKFDPDYAFNLHDQSSGYCAGRTYKSSTISLLAPPVNYANEETANVIESMSLCLSIKETLDEMIPGHIARYDDEFEPRAFGDNFAKDSITTILIEAGGWYKDFNREYVRKIYFASLLKALLSVGNQTHKKLSHSDYYDIPENKEHLYDLILRNVNIQKGDSHYKADLAIKREVKADTKTNQLYTMGILSDVGDLSTFHGYVEKDMSDYNLRFPNKIEANNNEKPNFKNLLAAGTAFYKSPTPSSEQWTKEPINFYRNIEPSLELELEKPANFFLESKGKINFAVINGFLINLSRKIEFDGNGLIYP